MRGERGRRVVADGYVEAVERGQGPGQQVLLEGLGGVPLLLEQQRVVDGERDAGGDGADEVTVEGVVVGAAPVGEVGQAEVHQAERLAAHAQRGDHRGGHADLAAQPGAALVGAGEIAGGEVFDQDRLLAAHRGVGVVARRIADLRAHRLPGVGRRVPALHVLGDPAHQPLTLHQFDEAVVGELRHQHLGDPLERLLDVEGARQPLTDAFEQAEAVLLALVAAHGLAGGDHDARHRPGVVTQRHRLGSDVDHGAVAALDVEGALPHAALEHVLGELDGERVILLHDAEREDGALPHRPLALAPEQLLRERIPVQEVAETIRHHDGHLRVVEDR
ncbi:hypothetical protein GCM10020219_058730 [Nonomuraea dietziae]